MKAPKLKHSPSSSNEAFSTDLQPAASTSASGAAQPYPTSKILACVACRNSKVKCISDGPEQCKRCLDHGLACIRPEYQRLKKAKAKLARFQQQASLSQDGDSKPSGAVVMEETSQSPPDKPILPQESPTTIFSNAFYGKSAQLLSNLHSVRPDVRDDWDPVLAGIVDLDTSRMLFDKFMDRLEALLSFFDPRIHSYDYIRSHSCLLFTTMCWLAATVTNFPSAPRVMGDLKNHIDNVLLPAIYCQNLRSVELVQAFLMLAAYLRPAQNPSEDRSWTLLGHAIRVATDLDMHSRILSTSQSNQASSPLPGADAASAEARALKRQEVWHQRNRERAWMHIWLHEASSSQYTGRVSLLSKDPIVESSRGWHLHPEALHTDVVFVALIELRSQLSQNKELFRLLSSRAAPTPGTSSSASSRSADADNSWIKHYLDRCNRDLSSWEERWVVNPSHSASHPRPLRFELGSLYICYARMQLLSLPLQWPTLQASMATRIVSDLHSVSIKYLEDFLDRTSPERLAHSYNSICVTATYAVVIALKLTKLAPSHSFINSARIIKLVTRVSVYLRQGGEFTPHQNGSSLSYAKYIEQLLDMGTSQQQHANQSKRHTPAADRPSEAYSRSHATAAVSASSSYDEDHRNGYTNGLTYRRTSGPALQPNDPAFAPISSTDRDRDRHLARPQPPSLQRNPSNTNHPLSSPRTIYTATPASDAGLFPRISSSPLPHPHIQAPIPPPGGPTTPSSHFALPPLGLPASDHHQQLQYATAAPGMAAEAGPSQWNFLANESELFAWARSFLNDDVDAMNTMPGASFH